MSTRPATNLSQNSYNAASHPVPFIKASSILAPKMVAKDVPDLEEAIEEDDGGDAAIADDAAQVDEDDDVDITKDKYIKQPKAKKAPAAKKAAASKKKAKKDVEDDDEDDDEVVVAKPAAKGRGRPAKKK